MPRGGSRMRVEDGLSVDGDNGQGRSQQPVRSDVLAEQERAEEPGFDGPSGGVTSVQGRLSIVLVRPRTRGAAGLAPETPLGLALDQEEAAHADGRALPEAGAVR